MATYTFSVERYAKVRQTCLVEIEAADEDEARELVREHDLTFEEWDDDYEDVLYYGDVSVVDVEGEEELEEDDE